MKKNSITPSDHQPKPPRRRLDQPQRNTAYLTVGFQTPKESFEALIF